MIEQAFDGSCYRWNSDICGSTGRMANRRSIIKGPASTAVANKARRVATGASSIIDTEVMFQKWFSQARATRLLP
jgi:hypothetical protein